MCLSRTTATNHDFQALVKLLDADLKLRDGDEHAFFSQYNTIDSINNVLVLYINNVLVGCGAFKMYDKQKVEIKRMYVLEDFRGKGIAQAILKELESWAKQIGYQNCILETGKKQPEAIRLYEKSGCRYIPNYGQYEKTENSVCFEKVL